MGIRFSNQFRMVPKGLKNFFDKLHTPCWLFVLLLIVLALRIPSFFEPYSYGDEMIYLTLGEAIRRGIPLYKGIHDNKPPLLYIIAAISGSLFWFKAILSIWHLITVFIFWKFAVALFPGKKKLHKVATAIFAALTTIPLLEGNIANAELFMIGPILGAFLILLSAKKSAEPKKIFTAGLLFSVATLFKIPAAFDVGAIVFLWIASNKLNLKTLRKVFVNSVYLAAGLLTPILLTITWYALRGALSEYLIAAFAQNFGYLSTWRPDDIQRPFLARNGPLFLRALIVAGGLGILYHKRKKLSKQFLFTSAWLLFTLFAVALSERPYPHYLIQSVAPIAILLAILFTEKTKEQTLVILPLALAFVVPVYFKFWYYPTTPYYLRFVKLASKQLTKDEYFATFGSQVLRNYKIADYVTGITRKDDHVFVWGDSSAIYALSRRFPPGRYVADYHIRDFSTIEQTIETLSSDMPRVVVILPDSRPPAEIILFLRNNYILIETIDGARIWNILSPGVRALIAS